MTAPVACVELPGLLSKGGWPGQGFSIGCRGFFLIGLFGQKKLCSGTSPTHWQLSSLPAIAVAVGASSLNGSYLPVSHIHFFVGESSIAVFACSSFGMVIIYVLRGDVRAVGRINALYRLKRIVHHLLLDGRSLVTVIINELMLHHHALRTHGIDLLLLLPAPRQASGAIIKKGVLCF